MTAFSVFFNIFVFYYCFGEKVTYSKILGMILGVICLIFLTVEASNKPINILETIEDINDV